MYGNFVPYTTLRKCGQMRDEASLRLKIGGNSTYPCITNIVCV